MAAIMVGEIVEATKHDLWYCAIIDILPGWIVEMQKQQFFRHEAVNMFIHTSIT